MSQAHDDLFERKARAEAATHALASKPLEHFIAHPDDFTHLQAIFGAMMIGSRISEGMVDDLDADLTERDCYIQEFMDACQRYVATDKALADLCQRAFELLNPED